MSISDLESDTSKGPTMNPQTLAAASLALLASAASLASEATASGAVASPAAQNQKP